MTGFSRALPFGATLVDRNRARFRLFAPAQPSVAVAIEGAQSILMQQQGDAWFEVEAPCGAGVRYRYVLASGQRVCQIRASRAQAGDVHDCVS